MEAEVLKGIDLSKYRPWIITIEAVTPVDMKPNHDEWQEMITSQGYKFVYFDGLNRFYLADEHDNLKNRFAAPPNISDELFRNVVDIRNQHPGLVKDKAEFQQEITRISEHFLSQNRVINDKALALTEEKAQLLDQQHSLNQKLQISESKSLNSRLQIENAHLKLEKLQAEKDSLSELYQQTQAQFLEVNHNYHIANQQLDQIVNSKLWACTYPYRRSREMLGLFTSRLKRIPKLVSQTILFSRQHGIKKTIRKVKSSLASTNDNHVASIQSENFPLTKGEENIYQILKG